MNIEKVKNYNAKMLAVLSTLLVGLGCIGLISMVLLLVSELWPRDNSYDDNHLLADTQVEQLAKDSLRKQIVSYDTPYLVDTAQLIYIIPVKVKTLNSPEAVDGGRGLVVSKLSSGSYSKGSYYQQSFNNLVVFDYKTGQTTKLSDFRYIGEELSFNYFKDDIIMLYQAALDNTDNDKLLTLNDLKALFVYSFNEKSVRQLKLPNASVTHYAFVGESKDLLVTFGQDRNGDGEFDETYEPTVVMKYDFEADTFSEVINPALKSDLQAIIEKPAGN